jgi:hypothetical protein
MRRARRLAAAPVIHLERPVRVAVFPSRLAAAFTLTKGRPLERNLRYTSLRARASRAQIPDTTCIPWRRRIRSPFPQTSGLGSRIA